MEKVLLLLVLWMAGIGGYAAHRGQVFIDRNANGLFDKGDLPAGEIMVSDGLHVVKTGKDGKFILPGHVRERFVFITVPSGYKCEQYYQPIEQDGSYQFALQAYPGVRKDGSHDFVQISDTEIFNTEKHQDWIDNLKDYAGSHQLAFVVHTGDICYENGLKAHKGLLNTGNTPCPVYYCIGNHDLVKGKYGEELFESIYGPVYYSFEVGNVHYIVTPMRGGDHFPGYTTEDVYRWMKNDLALVQEGRAVMVFNHDLLTDKDDFVFGISEGEKIKLDEYNLKAWIFGHWHINYMKRQGKVCAVSTATLDKGGIDHSTSAFRVMHVDPKGNFRSELRYSYLNDVLCLITPTEEQVVALPDEKILISVNTYRTRADVKEMVACLYADGNFLTSLALHRQTDWNWQGEMKMKPYWQRRQLELKVEVRYMNGEQAAVRRVFRYTSGEKVQIQTGSDWMTLGGSAAHQGKGDSLCKAPLRLGWLKNIGANIYMCSPVVAGGKVFIASVDENLLGEGGVYALDAEKGILLWKYKVRNSIKNTIAVDNGYVLAQDAEGWLYAINADTGKLCWEKKMNVKGLPALVEGLTAAEGIVYAGTGKGMVALRITDGKMLWQNQDWEQGEGTTTTLALGQQVLVGGAQWRALYANDARTGKLLWQRTANGLSNRGASAAMYDGLLYIISSKSLFIIRSRNGEVVVRRELPYNVDVTSTPLVTDRCIVFGSADAGLLAVDKETLELKWNFKTQDALVYTVPYTRSPVATVETSPVWAGGTVWVGASDGYFYGLDPETGRAVWKFATGAPVFSSVAVSGNTLFGADFSGNVYAFPADTNIGCSERSEKSDK